LDGFTTDLVEGSSYEIGQYGFEEPTKNFDQLFSELAKECPILYIPQKQPAPSGNRALTTFTRSKSDPQNMRQVSIPIPNMVVADGVLLSSEIDGAGVDDAFGMPHKMPRPVITFIFVYEYRSTSATASITDILAQPEKTATVTADQYQPTPHLVFKVQPIHLLGDGSMNMDDAGQKSHIIATFDTLRQTVSRTSIDSETTKAKSSLCDIAIYHGRGNQEILYGFSGLDQFELGLANKIHPDGPDLASCGSGNMAVDTGS
jgi:hypothetical protein